MFQKLLNNRILILYVAPLILGFLSVFSFQPYNFTLINFIILPSLFLLIIYIKKKSKSIYRKKPYKKNLFIFSSLFGFGFFLSGIHWINYSLTFDENFKILIPFGLIMIPLFLSLFFSLPLLFIGSFLGINLSSVFLFSGILSLSDYLRAKIFTGFPWNLWAYSFSWATEFLQILNKIGLFSFNLMSISIFMLPIIIFIKTNLVKKIIYFFTASLFIFLVYIYGNYSINLNNKKILLHEEKFFVKIVSPNFQLDYGLSNQEIENRLDNLVRYSEPNDGIKTLFVWPEGVFSGYNYEDIIYLKDKFSKNFDENHFILLGINTLNKKSNGSYNSLIIVNHKMEILQHYKKQKLVPFGEFLPFEIILKQFGLKKITEGYGSFLKGENQKNLQVDKMNILPLICYEIIFTEFVQKSEKNTNLIINISEDGWFGDSIGPQQHFAKAIFRAIEQNTYLLRSANKGVSAVINNKGEVLKKLDPSEAGNIELDVPLIKSKNKNKNDLIFFILLFTYIFVFKITKKTNEK